jgi:hypothetical protein
LIGDHGTGEQQPHLPGTAGGIEKAGEARQDGQFVGQRTVSDECPAPSRALQISVANKCQDCLPHRRETNPGGGGELAFLLNAITRPKHAVADLPLDTRINLVVQWRGRLPVDLQIDREEVARRFRRGLHEGSL